MKIVYQLLFLFLCLAQGRKALVADSPTELPCRDQHDSEHTCNDNIKSNAGFSNLNVDDDRPVSLDNEISQSSNHLSSIDFEPPTKGFKTPVQENIENHKKDASGNVDVSKNPASDDIILDPTETKIIDQEKNATESLFILEQSVKSEAPSSSAIPVEKVDTDLRKFDTATSNTTTTTNTTDKIGNAENEYDAVVNATITSDALQISDINTNNTITPVNIPDKIEYALQTFDADTKNTTSLASTTGNTEYTLQKDHEAVNSTATTTNTKDKTDDALHKSGAVINNTTTPITTTTRIEDVLGKSVANSTTILASATDKTEDTLQNSDDTKSNTTASVNITNTTEYALLKSDAPASNVTFPAVSTANKTTNIFHKPDAFVNNTVALTTTTEKTKGVLQKSDTTANNTTTSTNTTDNSEVLLQKSHIVSNNNGTIPANATNENKDNLQNSDVVVDSMIILVNATDKKDDALQNSDSAVHNTTTIEISSNKTKDTSQTSDNTEIHTMSLHNQSNVTQSLGMHLLIDEPIEKGILEHPLNFDDPVLVDDQSRDSLLRDVQLADAQKVSHQNMDIIEKGAENSTASMANNGKLELESKAFNASLVDDRMSETRPNNTDKITSGVALNETQERNVTDAINKADVLKEKQVIKEIQSGDSVVNVELLNDPTDIITLGGMLKDKVLEDVTVDMVTDEKKREEDENNGNHTSAEMSKEATTIFTNYTAIDEMQKHIRVKNITGSIANDEMLLEEQPEISVSGIEKGQSKDLTDSITKNLSDTTVKDEEAQRKESKDITDSLVINEKTSTVTEDQRKLIFDDSLMSSIVPNKTQEVLMSELVRPQESIINLPSNSSHNHPTDAVSNIPLHTQDFSLEDTKPYSNENKERADNTPFKENIAKSIETNSPPSNNHANASLQESRSFNLDKPEDMALMEDDRKMNNDDKDDDLEQNNNFSQQSQDLVATDQTTQEIDYEVLPIKPMEISEDIFVRKCCEDHEFFNLQSGKCQTGNLDFAGSVQKSLLNESKSLNTITGRIEYCPGTEQPPELALPELGTHSLKTNGHIKDKIYDLQYDHNHYCLEVGESEGESLFILAYCIPVTRTSVRKCCEEYEYFSTIRQQCESAGKDTGFADSIKRELLPDTTIEELDQITGILPVCPGTGDAPELEELSSSHHTLLPIGHLKDHQKSITFSHDMYCLELIARSSDDLANAEIALAYCLPDDKDRYISSSKQLGVRKCCASDEYFNSITSQCEILGNSSLFDDYVSDMHLGDHSDGIKHYTGRIQACPSNGELPDIVYVIPGIHELTNIGHLRDADSKVEYDHDNYCLEMAMDASHKFAEANMVAGVCPNHSPVRKLIRKCCKLSEYYDETEFNCFDRLGNMSNYNSLIHDFDFLDPYMTTSELTVGELLCRSGQMEIYDSTETYIDESGQLCQHSNGLCHPTSHYCIEHFRKDSSIELHAGAFICPKNIFRKCCNANEILTANGCVEPSTDYIPSFRLHQLIEVMVPMFGFAGVTQCRRTKLKQEDEIRWWVGNHGDLVVRNIDNTEINIGTYCIDDYKESLGSRRSVESIAMVCSEDVYHINPEEVQRKSEYIGKCCPVGSYLNHSYCIADEFGLNLQNEPLLKAANISQIVFTSFPKCQSGRELHWYPFDDELDVDFATIGIEQIMMVVSLENGCFISQRPINNDVYCMDYNLDEDGVKPRILVCPEIWVAANNHLEKYNLIAVLSGISCAALFATAFSLISMRVRRGLVTVKKVNTLAGRILLSYVLSYLMAFLLLAIGMKMNQDDGYPCSVLAGFLMFFLLAAFQWNTSICLESLLLTLRVSTSERSRYLIHSIWAWGVPGIITTIALTLDYHKDSLPCSVIIPRIGLFRCFFSDRNAQLLYLYLPMFVSLCANMGLLTAARYVRSAKLRRLELGGRGRNNQNTSADATEMQEQQSKSNSNQNTSENSQKSNTQHSGLRTHQTRNLWTESMKLVVWSGATWMAEVLSFLISRFVVLSESWYNYFWYLPSSINALRGVGIFVILVWTPETRHKVFKVVGALGSWAGSGSMARHDRSGEGNSTSGNHQSSMAQHRGGDSRIPGRRNMSIATTVTQISLRSGSGVVGSDSRQDSGKGHQRVAHSVSQLEPRRGSASSQASDRSEGDCSDTDSAAGGRRKSSLANFGLISLPSVDEEDVFEHSEPSSVPRGAVVPDDVTTLDNTETTSDV